MVQRSLKFLLTKVIREKLLVNVGLKLSTVKGVMPCINVSSVSLKRRSSKSLGIRFFMVRPLLLLNFTSKKLIPLET